MEAPRVCFDRVPPEVQYVPAGASRIALLKAKLWPNTSHIKVQCSKNSTPAQRKAVQETFEELMQFVNLDFTMTQGTGDIRISFDPRLGAWSYLGTDAATIPRNRATMNLGFGLNDGNEGTYTHEFGHAMGAVHEHQNPEGGIKWNREQVIRDLSGPPNNWDLETIENNMFAAYSRDQLNGSRLDPASIMMYAIPPRWTLDGFSVGQNKTLSPLDMEWLRKNYPGRDGPATQIIDLPVFDLTPVGESIREPGERDLFRVEVKKPGKHRFIARGRTPVVMALFGPNDLEQMIAKTDNAVADVPAVIDAALSPAVYHVQVTHAQASGTGKYELSCLLLPHDADPASSVPIWRGDLASGNYGIYRL